MANHQSSTLSSESTTSSIEVEENLSRHQYGNTTKKHISSRNSEAFASKLFNNVSWILVHHNNNYCKTPFLLKGCFTIVIMNIFFLERE